MTKNFLDDAYDMKGVEETESFYRDWSASYEDEVAENGYVTPLRCAEALLSSVDDPGAPLLDIGCGTGLSGVAFREAGFSVVDGTDLTPAMLDKAREKTGVYRNLLTGDLNEPLPVEPGAYTNMAAVGVLNPGHAPPETIDAVLDKMPSGGCFVLSLNDHALADPAFEARIGEHCDTGAVILVFKEYGEHLPKIGMKSMVYVLRKT